MIWKNQKRVGVGCVEAGSPGSVSLCILPRKGGTVSSPMLNFDYMLKSIFQFIYVTNYNKDQGSIKDNVLPPKK